jgi:MFS family permease
MKESRAFLQAKAQGKLSRAPLQEVFGKKENLRKVLVAFAGMVSGMTAVWYTAQFYALYFLIQSLRVAPTTANLFLGAALVLGIPFYIFFGWLSDRIGRKPVMMAGMLASVVLLFPLFKGLTHYANPQLEAAARATPVMVGADPATCGFQFDPVGRRKNFTDCDKVKALLSKMGVPYTNSTLPAGSGIEIKVGSGTITGFDAKAIQSALTAATYPSLADPTQMNIIMILVLLTVLIALAAMGYAPQAAALVEMFPTRIRYTALSVPYHAAVGWIGGLLPAVAFSLVVATGNIYYGLWYPVIVVSLSLLIGMCYLKETRGRDLHAD